jgi:hypothetical protein
MSNRPKIILHLAGHDFHPVYAQAEELIEWLSPTCAVHKAESLAAFEHLGECDLLIMMGMYFTGWEGRYRTPGDVHKRAFEKYAASGNPILLHHGAIASYDDWPTFRELVGIHLEQGHTSTTPPAHYLVRTLTSHPIVNGVGDFEMNDELFDRIAFESWTRPDVHAATKWDDRQLPVVITNEGRPGVSGAARTVYLAPGGNLETFVSPPVRQLWINSVNWCLGRS